jgi:hypothetical protein
VPTPPVIENNVVRYSTMAVTIIPVAENSLAIAPIISTIIMGIAISDWQWSIDSAAGPSNDCHPQ